MHTTHNNTTVGARRHNGPRGPEPNGMKSHEETRVVSWQNKRVAFDSLNMSRYDALDGRESLARGGETTTV